MKTLRALAFLIAITLLFALSARMGLALPRGEANPSDESSTEPPTAFSYQGYLEKEGDPYTGLCDFKLTLWNSPTEGQQIGSSILRNNQPLQHGYFSLQLDFGDEAFAGTDRWLAIEVGCPAGSGSATPLAERQVILPVPYALSATHAPWAGLRDVPAGFADNVDDDTTYEAGPGLVLDAPVFRADDDWLDERYLRHLGHVIVVAKQGGDFDKIQAAIDSISDAAPKTPYLIDVAPGWYTETVVLKPHVMLQGAGERSTYIVSAASNENLNPTSATLRLADHSSVRDLTVANAGAGKYNVAVLANPSVND